jgi:signal transduction histidine kinase/ActR/RegA family two-component response regulator
LDSNVPCERRIDELISDFAEPGRRLHAAGRLARRLGVDEVLLLVRDVRIDTLLPAPGMPRTLAGGPMWRRFLSVCMESGCHRGSVDLPRGSDRIATALASQSAVLVLIGGDLADDDRERITCALPLLSALLAAENREADSRSRMAEALASAQRATSLAAALEAARAEASTLNAQLRDEHERKDDFLAMLAHELRNPLAPITHSVEILRNPLLPDEVRTRLLDVIGRQSRQLSRLVEDLLDVSRVSGGRIELRRAPVDLCEVLQAAVDASQPVVASREHGLRIAVPDSPLWVHGDEQRLTQVFSNLLHNAAKYTEPGGRIEANALIDGDQVVVSITDNGIGIEPQMLNRVFDLFTQVPVSLDRSEGGLGIGLTLVRSLVDMHGGAVDAMSPGVGCGSTFTVRLPRITPPADAVRAAHAETRSTDCATRRLQVLVVDDNRDAAQTLGELLRVAGHNVALAFDGTSGLDLAEKIEPDLAILDIGLPEIDGLEVARRLRQRLGRNIRLVALTGYGSEEDRSRSLDAGFDEHWVKPLQFAELEQIMTGALIPPATQKFR